MVVSASATSSEARAGRSVALPSAPVVQRSLVGVEQRRVGDAGKVLAHDREGELVDWLDTGLGAGALIGITLDAEGRLLLVDAGGSRVLRIEP